MITSMSDAIAQEINETIKTSKPTTNLISDGYHTFGELYEHRIALWIAFCKKAQEVSEWQNDRYDYLPVENAWRTQYHSDGQLAFGGGWFVLGYGREAGKQMTYHLPMTHWDQCEFAETLEKAPEFDGHTSADVLTRINGL